MCGVWRWNKVLLQLLYNTQRAFFKPDPPHFDSVMECNSVCSHNNSWMKYPIRLRPQGTKKPAKTASSDNFCPLAKANTSLQLGSIHIGMRPSAEKPLYKTLIAWQLLLPRERCIVRELWVEHQTTSDPTERQCCKSRLNYFCYLWWELMSDRALNN